MSVLPKSFINGSKNMRPNSEIMTPIEMPIKNEVETYSDYMVYEGFLPATLSASDNLAANAENYIVGGTEDKTGNSEYFATFCATLPTCSFYPMQKAEWMDVRNGVIDVEQQVCSGTTTAQEALDALQASVTE